MPVLASEPLLKVKNLTKSFGHLYALRGVNLILNRGEFLTILGPNGAGKTTFIRILATLIKPTAGEVIIQGKELQQEAESLRHQIGLISHNCYLYGSLTAYENLLFFARLYQVTPLAERIEEMLELVGLTARKNDLVRTFSRGMLQRLAIARGMLHNPEIVFLDEPYTGLDLYATRMLNELLQQLQQQQRTVILITHNLQRGFESCHQIAILVAGRIIYQQPKGSISFLDLEQRYLQCLDNNDNCKNR